MGYGTNGLTFNALAGANLARLKDFRNSKGHLAHSMQDGSDWTPAQWLQAVVGELGEYANFRKKFERGDLTLEEFERLAAKELADVQIYLSILAMRCLDYDSGPFNDGRIPNFERIAHPTGIDLGRATMDKFNEVSKRVGSRVRLEADDWHYVR